MYDAVLLVAFGGPEALEDVLPFLENVLRGRNVPRERMLEVAEHYNHFGGKSPINEQNRSLIAALAAELDTHGPNLPVYWGNRNWHPLLPDTLRQMSQDGIQRALAFFTSAYSSYSGCRQYREDIERARAEVGPDAPQVEKLRACFNHPGFIKASADRVRSALEEFPAERREQLLIVYTAHSLPRSMASGCEYEAQVHETCRLVCDVVGHAEWRLVYQSRSGPPSQPWLEPNLFDCLEELRDEGHTDVVIMPIGFTSDHMEVIYDLDTEARQLCDDLGLNMIRASTVGTHPRFVTMIRELIEERVSGSIARATLGTLGPCPDRCPDDCCLYAPKRPAR